MRYSVIFLTTSEHTRKFELLYIQYRYLMLKIANDILHDNFLAEDAVHEAFIKIAQNIKNIKDVFSKATQQYVITITKNTAIDIYRKKSSYNQRETDLEEGNDCELPSFASQAESDHFVMELFENLPKSYQDVFILKYCCDLDTAQIARTLDIKQCTIRQRLARGKAILEEILKNDTQFHL